MFGAGWTEMLIIGIVALVVIGPKDLPIVMRKVGRVVGTIRRMGGEFQREINKTTGLDQIADLRRTITEPLRQTSDEIAKEFNRQTTTGVEPSGVIKPSDPSVESVYDQRTASAGLAARDEAPPPVMKPLASNEVSPAPGEATVATAKSRRSAKATDAKVSKPSSTKRATAEAPAKASVAKSTKPRAAKAPAKIAAVPVEAAPAPVEAMPLVSQSETISAKPAATLRRKPAAKAASAEPQAKAATPRARTKKA